MPTEQDHVSDAIAALTAAARGIRTIGKGTWSEHEEPADFGEIACHVLAAVAANVGGVENLLAGRPGSWEAEYVRQIVHSTAGDDPEHLTSWQHEPARRGTTTTRRASPEGETLRRPDRSTPGSSRPAR